jgi:hypothetical protein
LSPNNQGRRLENILAKTAIHVSDAALNVAAYVSAKRPANVRNRLKIDSGYDQSAACPNPFSANTQDIDVGRHVDFCVSCFTFSLDEIP